MILKRIMVAGAMIGSALGGSIIVTNNTGSTTQPVVDNSGNLIRDGVAALGTISRLGFITLTTGGSGIGHLTEVFDQFGPASTVGSTTGLIALNGVYDVSQSGDFALDPFRGKPMYLVLGNGADLASSSALGILRVGDFPSTEPSVLVINVDQNAPVVFGDYDRFTVSPGWAFGSPIEPQPAFSFGNLNSPIVPDIPGVPEPALGFLGLLGGFILLGRRNRTRRSRG